MVAVDIDDYLPARTVFVLVRPSSPLTHKPWGLLLVVVVLTAHIQDRDGAKMVFFQAKRRFPRLRLVWADGGYRGKLVRWTRVTCGWVLQIVKRTDDQRGFVVLPKRWIVERTFGWLNKWRRLSKD